MPYIRYTEFESAQKRRCSYHGGCQTILSKWTEGNLCNVHKNRPEGYVSAHLLRPKSVKLQPESLRLKATPVLAKVPLTVVSQSQDLESQKLEQEFLTLLPLQSDCERALGIIKAVLEHCKISLSDLLKHNNSRRFSRPRHLAIYLVVRIMNLDLSETGKLFGRHRETICEAYVHGQQLAKSPRVKRLVERAKSRFEVHSAKSVLQACSPEARIVINAVAQHSRVAGKSRIPIASLMWMQYDPRFTDKEIAAHRHIVMSLLTQMFSWTEQDVAMLFGLKSGGTVRYAQEQFKKRLIDGRFALKIKKIKMLCAKQHKSYAPPEIVLPIVAAQSGQFQQYV